MQVEIIDYKDNWQAVKNAAMNTVGKEYGIYPDSKWKKQILLAEHSPIRLLEFTIKMIDIPYWVSVHLVRHKIGVEHFVSTQRSDRTGVERSNLPQNAPVTHTMRINAQALISISRKRLCACASKETREVWTAVIEALREYEPVLATVCVRECVYRSFCPEMKSCGYVESSGFTDDIIAYSCPPTCEHCGWYAVYSGVCRNDDSDHKDDYTDKDFSCEHWEAPDYG